MDHAMKAYTDNGSEVQHILNVAQAVLNPGELPSVPPAYEAATSLAILHEELEGTQAPCGICKVFLNT
jgi:hypothetical protein